METGAATPGSITRSTAGPCRMATAIQRNDSAGPRAIPRGGAAARPRGTGSKHRRGRTAVRTIGGQASTRDVGANRGQSGAGGNQDQDRESQRRRRQRPAKRAERIAITGAHRGGERVEGSPARARAPGAGPAGRPAEADPAVRPARAEAADAGGKRGHSHDQATDSNTFGATLLGRADGRPRTFKTPEEARDALVQAADQGFDAVKQSLRAGGGRRPADAGTTLQTRTRCRGSRYCRPRRRHSSPTR